jgi:tetratricopeptide (TPR) repeat protein
VQRRHRKADNTRAARFVSLLAVLCLLLPAPMAGKRRKEVRQAQTNILYYNTLYLASVCQREKGNIAAQYELLQRALMLNPNAPEALFDLAGAASRSTLMSDSTVAQIYQKAIDGVEQILNRAKTPSDSAASASQLTEYTEAFARYQMARGRMDEAVPLWQKLTKNEAKRQEAYQMLATAYNRMERPDDVLKTLNEWETMEGGSSQVSLMKLQTFNRLHRYDDAIRVADSLARTDPRNDYFAVEAAESHLLKGDTLATMRLYRQLKKQFPQSPSVDLLLVHYYQTTNNHKELLNALETVILNEETDEDLKLSMMQSVENTLKGTSEEGRVATLFRRLMNQRLETTGLPELYAQYLASKKRSRLRLRAGHAENHRD